MNKLTDAEIIAIAEKLGLCPAIQSHKTIFTTVDVLIPFARAIEQRLTQPVEPTNFVGYATSIEPNPGS